MAKKSRPAHSVSGAPSNRGNNQFPGPPKQLKTLVKIPHKCRPYMRLSLPKMTFMWFLHQYLQLSMCRGMDVTLVKSFLLIIIILTSYFA